MVCDLLGAGRQSRRASTARFSAASGGELPLGNTVKVRVAHERAAEAREVIAEWEKQQTGDTVPPVTEQLRVKALLWFGVGAVFGGIGAIIMMNVVKPQSISGVDYDGDGRDDRVHIQVGSFPGMTTMDRNLDGAYDARWTFDSQGRESHYEADDDFDGRFEWQADVEYGEISRSVLDTDGDGRAEQVWRFETWSDIAGRLPLRERWPRGEARVLQGRTAGLRGIRRRRRWRIRAPRPIRCARGAELVGLFLISNPPRGDGCACTRGASFITVGSGPQRHAC